MISSISSSASKPGRTSSSSSMISSTTSSPSKPGKTSSSSSMISSTTSSSSNPGKTSSSSSTTSSITSSSSIPGSISSSSSPGKKSSSSSDIELISSPNVKSSSSNIPGKKSSSKSSPRPGKVRSLSTLSFFKSSSFFNFFSFGSKIATSVNLLRQNSIRRILTYFKNILSLIIFNYNIFNTNVIKQDNILSCFTHNFFFHFIHYFLF